MSTPPTTTTATTTATTATATATAVVMPAQRVVLWKHSGNSTPVASGCRRVSCLPTPCERLGHNPRRPAGPLPRPAAPGICAGPSPGPDGRRPAKSGSVPSATVAGLRRPTRTRKTRKTRKTTTATAPGPDPSNPNIGTSLTRCGGPATLLPTLRPPSGSLCRRLSARLGSVSSAASAEDDGDDNDEDDGPVPQLPSFVSPAMF
ncbi:hypothetical protein BGZ61DRAFT_481656 [Ilyonectria robusta]|uniref:uncharacterized protein n=1 Tax=Ilyonectria robusta TaxID=1079257 RepID=UPI001E8E40A1|nr:uncharacterized protein BGZ61DRAFT_481656 [Ilyonectria robusta]KAH8677038.1 hypothetical protein BGZ61DRAFT_481656 [Ilyonectria robusta]